MPENVRKLNVSLTKMKRQRQIERETEQGKNFEGEREKVQEEQLPQQAAR